MSFLNDVSLSDYPLSLEELRNLEVVFDDDDNTVIKTQYIIKTELELAEDETENNNLRALSYRKRKSNYKTNRQQRLKYKKQLEKKRKRLNNKKGRKLSTEIT